MLKWHLWIDDIRKPPNDIYWAWIKTTDEAIKLLKADLKSSIHIFDIISFDHDAGDLVNQGGDYIKILDWIEKNYPFLECPYIFHIHSMNPVGKENMERIIYHNNWSYIKGDIL